MDMKTSPLALLKDPTLLKTDALVNGQWVKGSSRFDVNDPATGAKLADVANLAPVAGSFTSKRLLPLTHWPLTKASVLRRVGSFNRAKGEVFMSIAVSLRFSRQICCFRNLIMES